MKIRSMHLENYRCFENFDIDFDDRLTVLVGANGAGKTATLDALGAFLRWVGHPQDRMNNSHFNISIIDMALGSNAEDITYRLQVQFQDNLFEQLDYILKSMAAA